MLSPLSGESPQYDSEATVVTLGPTGTDAQAEASKFFKTILLADSFEQAMTQAYETRAQALIAAGFLDRSGQGITRGWVDLHFEWLDRMRVSATWESPTKVMCLATNPRRVKRLAEVQSVAIHPSTEALARRYLPHAEFTYTRAKPIAVEHAETGEVDACLGSRDVVQRSETLVIHETFRPTMVWCLYEARAAAQRG